MKPRNFNLRAFESDRKYAFDLDLDPDVPGVSLPVLLVRGRKPGKILVVTAGVHGDEYEGVRAVIETYTSLDPGRMNGDFLAIPAANPPAFWSGTRTSPLDGGNLAREFPGSLEGGATAAIAYHLGHSVIAKADFFLDLHSAGIKLLMPTMVGYDADDSRSRSAALAFGANVLWAHSHIPPGRTISFARTYGIPWLYTEAAGAGRINADDLQIFTNGIRNLLCHLSILPGQPASISIGCHLCGDGDLDASIRSSTRGFFVPSVDLLQKVAAGDKLGSLVDLHGNTVETFRSLQSGVVAMMRAVPGTNAGDAVFLVTDLTI